MALLFTVGEIMTSGTEVGFWQLGLATQRTFGAPIISTSKTFYTASCNMYVSSECCVLHTALAYMRA